MTSWHENDVWINGPLWVEFTCGFPSQRSIMRKSFYYNDVITLKKLTIWKHIFSALKKRQKTVYLNIAILQLSVYQDLLNIVHNIVYVSIRPWCENFRWDSCLRIYQRHLFDSGYDLESNKRRYWLLTYCPYDTICCHRSRASMIQIVGCLALDIKIWWLYRSTLVEWYKQLVLRIDH